MCRSKPAPTYAHTNDNASSINMGATSLGKDAFQEHQHPLLYFLGWAVPASTGTQIHELLLAV
jgi:hypothetical protein